MSYNEVEELRKTGSLEDAYQQATADLAEAFSIEAMVPKGTSPPAAEINDDLPGEESLIVLGKRALSWVLYDYLKQNTDRENFDTFLHYLHEFVDLKLDPSEKMVTNQLLWVIGKSAFEFTKDKGFEISRMEELLTVTLNLNFSKQSKGYSFLFKAFHKALKDSPRYIDFASWWDLWSFIRDDYKYTRGDDGKKIMAVAEQGFNRYAKHLLQAFSNNPDDETKAQLHKKMLDFLPVAEEAMKHNKHYNKLPYFYIKLLFALGESRKGNHLLMRYVRQDQNEFWIWELLAESFSGDPEKQITCLCNALLCRTKLEKVLETRVELAGLFIDQGMYDEAKTEIGQILRCCLNNKYDIPEVVTIWGEQPWYNQAQASNNNIALYESYKPDAHEIIFGDIPERKVVVETLNSAKKILNFLGTDYNRGYFKYDSVLKQVKEGDILLVRIKSTDMEGRYTLFSAKKLQEKYVEGILKHFSGEVIKPAGKNFAFADSMFITPDLCSRHRLANGHHISGKAMISYNKKKEEWGWKVISVD
jgi:tetratricopeptide (TPR) repeat protein